MDLRTKLVFALVLTALGSMFALGSVAFSRARVLVRETTLDHIGALAQTRMEAVDKLVSGWEERVSLIASRTQLRRSVDAFNRTGDPEAVDRVRTILADAVAATGTVRAIEVWDASGRSLVRVTRPGERPPPESPSRTEGPARPSGYRGIAFPDGAAPDVWFESPLILDGERVGALEVVLAGWELRELVESVEGMGRTGQTILSARDLGGVAHVMRPGRAGASGLLEPLADPAAPDPVGQALEGREGRWHDVLDRRGVRVWAASRAVPGPGWGLTVAFDEEEEVAPLRAFRSEMTDLALALSAIAILIGTLLGLRFAKPLHDLAGVADRVRGGDLSARAPVGREDEIGLLARTFNEMTDELEGQVVLLREFRKFFDVSLDMMCIAGTDGYFKRVNPAFSRTLGWGEDKLLGEPFFDLVHPDDVAATEKEVAKLSEGVPTVSFRNRFRCADGSYRALRWASYPDPDTGLLYAIARDVTDLESD